MKKWLLIFAALFSSLNALPRVPVQQVVQYNNQFAFDLYRTIAKNQNNSFVIASYSISCAFAITYLGSQGDTQRELATIFRYPLSPNYLGESFKRINQGLSSDKNLKLASSVWMDRSFDVLDSFKGLVNQYYEGLFFEDDFSL
ncbi:MAG: serpin family protein, partial [Parachlamydiaceae bacterium]